MELLVYVYVKDGVHVGDAHTQLPALVADGATEYELTVDVSKVFSYRVDPNGEPRVEYFDETVVFADSALNALRTERDAKLKETDWWVLPDRTATQAQLDYRQALRDITNTYTSPDDVVWPEKPEA